MKINHQKYKHKMYSALLIVFMFIGLLCSIFLVHERIQLEGKENHIENIVNYEAVMREAAFEKAPKSEVIKDLKKAGVTAMAIYDRTIEKMKDSGDITVLSGDQTGKLYFSDSEYYGTPGKTYIIAARNKEDQFNEIWESLKVRYGAEKVIPRQTIRGLALELDMPYSELKSANIGISRIQAQDVINMGFNVIVRPTNYAQVTKSNVDFFLKQIEGLPNITGVVFVGKEALGYPSQIPYLVKRLNDMRIPIVGIEATSQLQYEPQKGFLEMAAMENYEVGRLYTIAPDYLKKLEPERVSQMFFISDMERNIRYNLFPIFERGYENKTPLQSSIAYMANTSEKLKERGFVLGRASIYPDYFPNIIPLMGTMIGAIALTMFTFSQLVTIGRKKQILLFLILALGSIIAYVLASGVLVRQIWALGAAIFGPVNAIVLCMNCWRTRYKERRFLPKYRAIVDGIIYSAIAFLIALYGGLLIAALLGSNDFFMEFSIFRGVKLAFIMPVILTTIAYVSRFPIWNNYLVNSKESLKRFLKEFLNSEVKIYTLLAFGTLAFVAWIFIGRSGNESSVPVPNFEIAMRHYLENIMYARPREKEFLIGYPAMLLCVYALYRKWPLLIHYLCTLGAVIGLGSMVETFAHVRTPVLMSLIRGADGLGAGVAVGLVLMLFVIIGEKVYDLLKRSMEAPYE